MNADARTRDPFSCHGCQPGKSTQNRLSTLNCTACNANEYQPDTNQSTCKICPSGQHNDGNGGNGAVSCTLDASGKTKKLVVVLAAVLGLVCASILVMCVYTRTKSRHPRRRNFSQSLTQRLINPTQSRGHRSRYSLSGDDNGTELQETAEQSQRYSLPGWGSGRGWTTSPVAFGDAEPLKSLSTAVNLAPAHFGLSSRPPPAAR